MKKVYTSVTQLIENRSQVLTKHYCYTVALEQLQRAEAAERDNAALRAKLRLYELADIGRCDVCNSELVDHGFPIGKTCPVCDLRAQLEQAQKRITELERKTFYHPAFDEGDGVYRP